MSKVIESRVIVVGGGIVGVSAAYHMARRGVSVTLLERDTVGSKASGVNFGGLRTNGREIPELSLSLRSMVFWNEPERHLGRDCDVVMSGHLEVTNDERQMAVMEKWAHRAREYGLEPALMSPAAIGNRWPWLTRDILGGCFMPSDGSANPRLVTPYLAKSAESLGANVCEHLAVSSISHDGRYFTVETGSGRRFRSEQLINCAGAWAGRIADSLGDKTPWDTIAPQMVVSEPLPYRIGPIVETKVGDRYLYLRQTPRGNILFGRGPGEVDLDAARAFVIPQNNFNASRIALDLVPFMEPYAIIRTWSGIEGKMPDSFPVIDFSPSVDGLIHGFGFSGHGFQLGPAAGAVLAELATAGKTETDTAAFNISRFSKAGTVAQEQTG